MYNFGVAHNTVSKIIHQVCEVLIAEYARELLSTPPQTPEQWKAVAQQFGDRWQLYNSDGALSGKHIAIQGLRWGSSLYYSYKGFHSIVLMALVDADYKFIWAEVGSNGSAGDAQVFKSSELKEVIVKQVLGLPETEAMPNDDRPMPFCIASDDAFTLKTWLMKQYSKRNLSYSERVFHYRLSQGQCIVKYVLDILAHCFRCLHITMLQSTEWQAMCLLACAFIFSSFERIYFPHICTHHVVKCLTFK